MRKQTIILLLLVISINALSQQPDSLKTFTGSDYLKKSKNQKKAAWIFLGSGFAVSAAGLIVSTIGVAEEFTGVFTGQESKKFETGAVIFYIGVAAMLTSIPFFVIASKNKKRAAGISASFKFDNRLLVTQAVMMKSTYPAIALKIPL